MEADHNFLKLEDDLNLFQMEDDLNCILSNLLIRFLVCKIVSTHLDEIWKTISIFLKMEDDLNFC
jgi:hypothetical protein